MSDMYRDHLLDHAKRPRNYGVLEGAHITRHEANPSCGDVVDVYMTLQNDRLERLSFTGRGCVISQAAASIVIQQLIGASRERVLATSPQEVLTWLMIEPGPMRMNCALLGLRAVQGALKSNS